MRPIQAAQRTDGVRYAIRDVVMAAREHAASGMDMLFLNIGDPIQFDFETPQHVLEAISKSMMAGDTGYCPSEGTDEAIEAIGREAKAKGIEAKMVLTMISISRRDISGAFAATTSINSLFVIFFPPF